MSSETSIELHRRVALTPSQRSLLASQMRSPSAPVQNMALLARFDGDIDTSRLAAAIDDVVASSDVLRTTIDATDPSMARVTSGVPAPTMVLEIDAADVAQWVTDRACRPLELDRACYDSVILRDHDGATAWFCNFHHLVVDAASYVVFFDAVAEAYDGQTPVLASYYSTATELSADTPARRRALDHWSGWEAAPRPDRLYAPTGRGTSTYRATVEPDDDLAELIDSRLAGDYAALSADLAATALLVTATALQTAILSGVDSVSVGVPVHNRRSASARNTVGPLMEVFPVDVQVTPTVTARELHKSVLRSLMTMLRHAVHGTVPDGHVAVVVNVIADDVPRTFGDLAVTVEWIATGAMDADHLERVQLTGYGSSPSKPSGFSAGTTLHLDLDAEACPPFVQPHAPDHFAAALRFLVTDPDAVVSSLVLATEGDRAHLDAWETGPTSEGPAPLVGDTLRRRLIDDDSIVVRDGDDVVTGRELWNWIEAYARDLRTEHRVMVELAPSVQAVVAVAAAVVAGIPFVPVDPAHPEARRDRLAIRSAVTRRVRGCADVDPFRGMADPTVISSSNADSPEPNDEAYVIFTSGSTGEPKGVPISQQGLADYLRFAVDSYFDADRPIVACLFGSLSFDLTITSLFAPLLAGGSVVTIGATGPAALGQIAEQRDITWIKATPSHLEVLVRLLPVDHRLSTFVVGGEAFGTRLAGTLLRHNPAAAIFNEYGPTEAVVGCMIYELEATDIARLIDVPIGHPAPNVTLRVADPVGNRLPRGATGELWISHAGVTAGYLAAEDEAAEEKAAEEKAAEAGRDADPFVDLDGHRWYRSGDAVQLDASNRLVYRGRLDEQLKVGAIRLDPLEVEAALDQHPAVEMSVVRMWAPESVAPTHFCSRCGLPDTVPGAVFDGDGICDTCAVFDVVEGGTRSWFKTPDDLAVVRDRSAARASGKYDCLALVSGGKDSTYALYRLIELGFRPYALTLDNGFISEGAKDNVRNCAAALGVDHEFVTTEHMNEIFRDSLATHSNVCHGCYKTIYTLAVNRAVELGIPTIVTGLSRGQLFETRLVPEQFRLDRFDPDAIDRAVLEARKHYHRAPDLANRLLDTEVFADDDIFDRIEFVDIYRYLDVELQDMLHELTERTPWKRPADTGRSTNCLINVAGIQTHLIEQGYHNYAVPYAWDVRLGHKTREEAIAELHDHIDPSEVGALLEEVGYAPRTRETLTAWIVLRPGAELPSPTAFRSFLAESLPAHAVPSAFVAIDELPMTTNGKLDSRALPAPKRLHRSGVTVDLLAGNETERLVIEAWETALGIEPIGLDDDFFAIGGDSLLALETIVRLGNRLDLRLGEELAFIHTTPRNLAAAIEEAPAAQSGSDLATEPKTDDGPRARARSGSLDTKPFTVGEQSVLFEQHAAPERQMFNLGRVFRVHGPIDEARLSTAITEAISMHRSMTHGYGAGRPALDVGRALDFSVASGGVSPEGIEAALEYSHRLPFDVIDGPLVRCRVQPVHDGTTAVLLAAHHVTCDLESLAVLWRQIDRLANDQPVARPPVDLLEFDAWQRQHRADEGRSFWLERVRGFEPTKFLGRPVGASSNHSDGFIRTVASVRAGELAAVAGRTPTSLSLAAAAAALGPYFERGRVPLALVASTRTHADAAELVGYLLNPLPLQIDASGSRSVGSLVDDAVEAIGPALVHRGRPIAEIVADGRAEGITFGSFDVLVSVDAEAATTYRGAPVTQHAMFNGDAVADLSFFVEIRRDVVEVSLEYRASTVGRALAEVLVDRFSRALTAVTHEPSASIAGLGVGTATSVAIGDPLDSSRLLLDQIFERVVDQPAGVAVRCGDDELTWAELGCRSELVADMIDDAGVSPGSRIILAVPRSTELIVSIVGVLRAGCSYVPLDPDAPTARIDRITAAARVAASIVGPGLELAAGGTHLLVTSEGVAGRPWHSVEGGRVDTSIDADTDAYVIFTSGSTGTPAGVAVTHGQLAASTNSRRQVYATPVEEFVVLSNAAFDSSIVGVFWTLADGGTVVVPTERQAHDIDAIVGVLTRPGVSHVLCVPTLYRALLQRRPDSAGSWPRQVIVAGEACPTSLVVEHFDVAPDTALTNEYGPTEATVWATAHHCARTDESAPVGRPVPGAWVAVVDADGWPVPEGVVGELLIGGVGVTAGYVDDAEKTAARFGRSSEQGGLPPGRTFATGDRAEMCDGIVWFLGRIDDQLNVGGVRLEPAEIEAVLLRHSSVEAVVVGAVDPRSLAELIDAADAELARRAFRLAAEAADPSTALADLLRSDSTGRVELVAHVQTNDSTILPALRRSIADALPTTMRPQRYQMHATLPMTPNGKTDRAATLALPLSGSGNTAAVDRPETPAGDDVTSRILATFRTVLSAAELKATDSFFEHGGDSLQSLVALYELEASLGLTMSTSEIFEHPTAARLAEHLLTDPERLVALPSGSDSDNDGTSAAGATGARRRRELRSLVVPIATQGERPPFFAVHHIGTDGELFRPMSAQLGPDQPMYGLAAPLPLEPFGAAKYDVDIAYDVAAIANAYVTEIERLAPAGPIVIGGTCQGALFAYEVAQQLKARGRDVPLLVMLTDWHAPHIEYSDSGTILLRKRFLDLRQQGWPGLKRLLSVRGPRLRLQRRAEISAVGLVKRFHIGLPHRLKVREYIETSLQHFNSYQYEPYNGAAIVVRGSDDRRISDVDQTAGWGDLIDDLDIEFVPGWGITILREPNAVGTAEIVRSALDDIAIDAR